MQHVSLSPSDAALPGSAGLVLAREVAFVDPEAGIFEAMIEGWRRQQRVRFLKSDTIKHRVRVVRRMAESSNQYPWQWTAAEVEAFIDYCIRANSIQSSTARSFTDALRVFLAYVTDPRYGWTDVCLGRFGSAPQMVVGEWNSVAHTGDYEGGPGRRPLSYDEVQRLFDAADDIVETVRASRRKGSLAAQRDAAILKCVYAFGLRRREAWGLDLTDLRRNPKVAAFGKFGALYVRWGKSQRGGPPRRRTVMLVPEMDWIVPVLQQWVDQVRPLFEPGQHSALWVTERRGRLDWRGINAAFAEARDLAGLPRELDLHCLRHSYVTHLVEFDYPERFVQEQVGHAYAATTAIYTGVSDAYRNTLLRRAIDARQPGIWGTAEEGAP